MAEHNINIVHLKISERSVKTFDQSLSGGTEVIDGIVILGEFTPEDFGGDNVVGSWYVQGFDGNTELSFSLSGVVSFGGIEEIDTVFPGSLDKRVGDVLSFIGVVGVDPVTVGESGDLQSRST